MSGIFISYRREDSSGWAGRLSALLKDSFGADQLFMDIDTIEAGVDFVEVIGNAVGSCKVLLAVIGPQWLTVTDAGGRRRLDNPQDFIRLEVAAALKRNIRVIPVLVGGAGMPSAENLPQELEMLARRQAHELSDKRWDFDSEELVRVLEKTLGRRSLESHTPSESIPAEQIRPQTPSTPKRVSAKAIASLILIVLLFALFATEDLLDRDTVIGGLVVSFVALGLGISAFYDATRDKVKGRILAITNMVLSALLCVALFGKFPSTENSLELKPTDTKPADNIDRSRADQQEPLRRSDEDSRSSQSEGSRQPVTRSFIITGNWLADDGYTYIIEQQGTDVKFVGMDALENIAATGEGQIVQRTVVFNYVLADYTTGSAQLELSGDGQIMQGTYRNHVTGLSGVLVLHRE